jgi:cell wall-associated NlpC family hydrolase
VTRKTRGAAVALILMLASASSASAAQPTGGTSAQSTTTTAPATPAPAAPATPAAPAATTALSATQTVTLTRSQTKKVQRRVKVRADGAVGARTRSAIRRYQAKKRLTRTGRPNLETIRAMKMPFVAQVERKLAASAATDPEATTRQAPAAASGDLATAIAAARSAIGTPYSSGGTNTSGFDCSGLMVWSFDQAGIDLPRTSFDQYEVGTAVEQSDIQPGDLVFFSTAGPGASHVGVAVDATTVISATTRGVMAHKLNDDYWGAAYVGARRLPAA